MGTLKGVIRDSVSGASVEAKVHVLTSSGSFVHPADSILKIGPGDPFFYCPGEFTVDVPRGSTDIVVERGTEYEPLAEDRFYARERSGRGRVASQTVGKPSVTRVVSGKYASALQ